MKHLTDSEAKQLRNKATLARYEAALPAAKPKSGALRKIARRLDAKLAAAREANEEPNF